MKKIIFVTFLLLLAGCQSTRHSDKTYSYQDEGIFNVPSSRLNKESTGNDDPKLLENDAVDKEQSKANFLPLESIYEADTSVFSQKVLNQAFSTEKHLSLAVEAMSVRDFVHYVFGEVLIIDYVIDKELDEAFKPITLNIVNKISDRELFDIALQQLMERGLAVKFDNGLYFVYELEDVKKENKVIAIGKDIDDVPQTTQNILQIVQLDFGITPNLVRTIDELTQISRSIDYQQNILFLSGKRSEIQRALEFIALLDRPSARGKSIGILNLTYISVDEFSQEVIKLLDIEGIPVAQQAGAGKNVFVVPLTSMGSAAVFATSEALLKRVKYWANVLDAPKKGAGAQFFTYKPKFARATDIGESLGKLIGLSLGNNAPSSNQSGNTPSANRTGTSNQKGISMVVDERINAIIIYAPGETYQQLLPLIRELDVLPKQVMLDITIAEVSLKDEFKFGVEWALQNSSEVTLSTLGAFGATSIGGLSIAVNGAKGPITGNANKFASLVKVLSNPTLLVRDGVDASINIGSQISVVGSTTTDPLTGQRQTTSSEYRDTGVNVSVTPTINAQGVVILTINQSISNTVPDSSGAGGNPDIFSRTLQTEVIANDGQTILMAGLISEDNNRSGSKVPVINKVPLLGALTGTDTNTSTRTELVMLITPRIIEDNSAWEDVKSSLKDGIKYLDF